LLSVGCRLLMFKFSGHCGEWRSYLSHINQQLHPCEVYPRALFECVRPLTVLKTSHSIVGFQLLHNGPRHRRNFFREVVGGCLQNETQSGDVTITTNMIDKKTGMRKRQRWEGSSHNRGLVFLSLVMVQTTASFLVHDSYSSSTLRQKAQVCGCTTHLPKPTLFISRRTKRLSELSSTSSNGLPLLDHWKEIRAAARTRNAQRADSLLGDVLQEYEKSKDPAFLPSLELFNTVLTAWSRSGASNAPQRADAVLARMWALVESEPQKPWNTKPDLESYKRVIECWTKSRRADAGERTETILKDIRRLYAMGDIDFQPDAKMYTEVLNAFARRGKAVKAEALLESMIEDCLSGNESVRPNVISFSVVLNAWSKCRSNEAPERAEAVLSRMRELYQTDGEKWDTKPNAVSYTSVMDCWAKSRLPMASQRAEAWLRATQELFQKGEEDCRLNSRSYTAVLDAFARRGQSESAEAILEEMCKDFANGNRNAKPDVVAYTTVLSAWSRSQSRNAPERAEAILSRMWELYKSNTGGGQPVKPNVVSYTGVIDCWAKSAKKHGAQRAEALLREMQRLSKEEGHKDLTPGFRTYNTVLNAFARRGHPEKAEAILEEMYRDYLSGRNPSCKPTVVSYTTLMNAWGKSHLPEAPARAEEILANMWELYQEKNFDTKPDMASYTCVADCWAKSRDKAAGDWAEAVLREAEQLYMNGDKDFYPDIRLYNAVLNAFAQGGNGDQAQALLEELLPENASGKNLLRNPTLSPTVVSFNSVLNAWSKSRSSLASEKVESLLAQMKSLHKQPNPLCGYWDTKPNVVSYNSVIKCWAMSEVASVEKVQALLDEMLTLSANGDRSASPNIRTYNQVLDIVASANELTDQLERIESILTKMNENGIVPDTISKQIVSKFGMMENGGKA
jgi:pentatricopeptide repeat protein